MLEDIKHDEQTETHDEAVSQLDGAFEQPVETGPEETTNPWQDFTPSKFGLDERYDKLPPDQFAKEIQFRNQTYGRQSQELGELRRKHQDAEARLAKFMEAADKQPETPKQVNELDEFTKDKYYKLLEQGRPDEATRLVLGDSLKPKYDSEDFQKAVDDRVQEHLSQYYTYTAEEGIKRDPDYPKYSEYIELLKTPEHFGNQRNPSELMEFSRLAETNKSLADLTYHNMKRYPSMSFDDAKKFAGLTMGSGKANEEKKDKFKKELNKLDGVSPSKGSADKAVESEQYDSMDEAFA